MFNDIFFLLFFDFFLCLFFFFFSSRRRHTRWPRDWSSDVCSSDLARRRGDARRLREGLSRLCQGGWGTIGVPEEFGGQGLPFAIQTAVLDTLGSANMGFALAPTLTVGAIRSEERRVGKECRSRWWR